MKKYIPYIIIPYVVYWTSELYQLGIYLGLWPYDEMSAKAYFVSTLIFFNPISLFLFSSLFGYRRGFSLVLPLLLSLGFFVYNSYVNLFYPVGFTLFYELTYAIISLLGILLGMGLKKLRKTMKNT